MKSQQSDKKTTKQIRIDAGWHKILKVLAAQTGRSIRDLIEECLGDYYGPAELVNNSGPRSNKRRNNYGDK